MYKSTFQSKIGILEIVFDDNYLYKLSVVDKLLKENVNTPLSNLVIIQLTEYLDGLRKTFEIPIKLEGTDFQIKVWNELLKIGYSETKTYKEIAIAIGNENAQRAVGNANNRNPIMIIVPCHRVIGTNKKLIGYAFGLDVKEKLLKIERNDDYNL